MQIITDYAAMVKYDFKERNLPPVSNICRSIMPCLQKPRLVRHFLLCLDKDKWAFHTWTAAG